MELYLSIEWFAVAILDGNFPMMGAAITPKNLLVFFFSFSKEREERKFDLDSDNERTCGKESTKHKSP